MLVTHNDKTLFHRVSLHAMAGGCLGSLLFVALMVTEAGVLGGVTDGETITTLALAFASYFSVGSALSGFLLFVTE